MLQSILRFSARTLRRQGGYVFLNVFGLSIGLVCSLILGLYIRQELSFDRYHEHADRLYRVSFFGVMGGQEVSAAFTPAAMGPVLADELPGVEAFLRLNPWGETVIQYGDDYFVESHFLEADSSFFDFFSIRLLAGERSGVLRDPNTLVISQSTARRIFGDEDPMGKSLRVGGGNMYMVNGIMEDIPANTHFHANMIGSFVSNQMSSATTWLSNSYYTYLKLYPGASVSEVEVQFEALTVKHVGPEVRQYLGISIEDFLAQGNVYEYSLQPVSRIHLQPEIQHDMRPQTDPKYLWIFGGVGLLILVIASINFMNLSTAQAGRRAREVGVKKAVGSSSSELRRQFVAETMLLSLLAMLLAVGMAEIILPWFNTAFDFQLSLNLFSDIYTLPLLLALALGVGYISGIYPAWYLSSFDPVKVLKGASVGSRHGVRMRQSLTVLQFAISMLLISGSLIMFRQIHFLMKQDLGFDKEQILVISRAYLLDNRIESFKQDVLQWPAVVSASSSTALPGRNNNNNGYMIRGRGSDTFLMQTAWVDHDFLETFGMQLTQGRFFNREMPTDRHACLINQRAAAAYNIEQPLETHIIGPGFMGTESLSMPVIGIVRDFHFESLHYPVAPYIIRFKDEGMNWGYFSIRLSTDEIGETIRHIESIWDTFVQGQPMLYSFVDDDFSRMYQTEQKNARLSLIFTVLAIVIASLGLFALTSFSLQQRVREMGIRKTYGASELSIWMLISREILMLLGLAALIAWPLIYWAGSNWLQNFHYRISIHPMDFLSGFLLAVLIAFLTISWRVRQAARANPIQSLRYE